MYKLILYRFIEQDIEFGISARVETPGAKDAVNILGKLANRFDTTADKVDEFTNKITNSGSTTTKWGKNYKDFDAKSYLGRFSDLIVKNKYPTDSNMAKLQSTIMTNTNNEFARLLSSDKWLPDKRNAISRISEQLGNNENITVNRNLIESLQGVANAREEAAKVAKKEKMSVYELNAALEQEANNRKTLRQTYSTDLYSGIGNGTLNNKLTQLPFAAGVSGAIPSAASNLQNFKSVTGAINKDFESIDKYNESITNAIKNDLINASPLVGVIPTMNKNMGTTISMFNALSPKIMNVKSNVEGIPDHVIMINKNVEETPQKVEKTTGKVKSLADALKNAKSPAQQLKDIFHSLELVKLVYLWRSIRRVTSGLVEMIEKAANYEESLNLYAMSFGKYADRATLWMERMSGALKLDPSQVMQYAGAFNNLVKGMGVTSDAAYIMSTNLTQLTYDMASYLNISNEAAQAKIQSAMAGQSRAVASVGVATQMASLQELALSLGIEKSVSEMTQAEKTYLRYIQLMRSTTHMQGDLGKTMLTPANAIRTLKNQIELLGRAIGQVLTPIIMRVLPYIMAMTNVLTKLAAKLAEFLGYKITDVDYTLTFEDIGEALDGLGKQAEENGNKVKNSLAPFDELNQVMSESSTVGGGGNGDDNSVINKLKDYISGYDILKNYTGELVKQAEKLEGTAGKILGIIGTIVGLSFLTNTIIKISQLYTAIKAIGDIPLVASILGSKFGTILTGVVAPITAIIAGLGVLANIAVDLSTDISKELALSKLTNTEPSSLLKGLDKYIDIYTKIESILLPGVGTLARGAYEYSKEQGETEAYYTYFERLKAQLLATSDEFGSLKVSTEEWMDTLSSSSGSLYDYKDRISEVDGTLQALYGTFKDASDKIELMHLTFRATGDKISEEDAKKIKDAVSDMSTSAKNMIDTNINSALLDLGDLFRDTSTVTETEEDRILNHIKTYGEEQKKEIDSIQNTITTTYNNGIKKRGYLTDEEYTYIETQLSKLRALTETEMSRNNATILRLKDQLGKDSTKLDVQSYATFNEALDKYHDEQIEKYDTQYARSLSMLQAKYGKEYETNKDYIEDKKVLDKAYLEQEEGLKNEIAGYREQVYKNLVEYYKKIRDKNDTESLAMKENIEQILIDAKIDPTSIDNFTGQFMDVGTDAVKELEAGWNKNVNKAGTSMIDKLTGVLSKAWDTNPISKVLSELGIDNPFRKFSGGSRGFATGGYLESGDYFYMNERGNAEFMGSIGGQKAVVNQDQMVQSLATVITNAMANMGYGNNQNGDTIVYIGNEKVYQGQGEYQNRQADRWGTNVIKV